MGLRAWHCSKEGTAHQWDHQNCHSTVWACSNSWDGMLLKAPSHALCEAAQPKEMRRTSVVTPLTGAYVSGSGAGSAAAY